MKPFIFAFCAAGIALLSGCAVNGPTSGPYSVVAYRPKNPNNVRVKVSLSKQNVYVMEGDKVLMAAATCVGQPGHTTPTGTYRIYSKIPDKRSGAYGFRVQDGGRIIPAESGASISGTYVGYPMAWWCEFSPGFGFHQGYVWPMPRTHGCLRLHKAVAPKFYALVKIGTPVNIANSQPEDATVKVVRPQDYRDPDPPASYTISSAVFQKPAGELLQEQP